MQPDFRIRALPLDPFLPILSLDDGELGPFGARWVTVTEHPGFPCRVSLRDVQVGERVLLTPYIHHDMDSPYRASGPIFVHPQAVAARPDVNEVPSLLANRTLSVRGYGRNGDMKDVLVCHGSELRSGIDRLFGNAQVELLHVHNAAAGCYLCRVERVAPGSA